MNNQSPIRVATFLSVAISSFALACIFVLLMLATPAVFAHEPCGGHNQRACCVGEDDTCDGGLVEIPGCSGNCSCGFDWPLADVESSGTCISISSCGGAGQRACCLGEKSFGACRNADLVEIAGCNGNCYCGGSVLGIQSSGHCVDRKCGGDGERACTLTERIPSCDAGLFEDLTEAGSCENVLGASNCIPPGGGLPSIGMCTSARKAGETCSLILTPPCDDGLVCTVVDVEGLEARCFSDASGLLSKEQCSVLRSDDLLRLAVSDGTTLSFGIGSGFAAAVTYTEEFGIAYGRDGCFSCYQSQCYGYEADIATSIFTLVGGWDVDVVCDPDDTECLGFDGAACAYAASADIVGDIGFTGTAYFVGCDGETCPIVPDESCTFSGLTDSLTFGVGINPSPIEVSLANCNTAQTVVGCLDGGSFREIVNEPPVCENGDEYVQECNGLITSFFVDGSDSSDPDNDPLSFSWSSTCPGGEFLDASAASTTLYVDSFCHDHAISCSVGLTVNDGIASSSCPPTPVTVVDTIPPSFSSCPGDIFQLNNAGQCSSNVVFNVTADDTCSAPVVACEDQNGDPVATNGGRYGVGTTGVTCTATDCSGNSSQCLFNVTVNDPPQIISVTPATQLVQYSDQIKPVVVTATDCGVADLTLEFDAGDVPAGLSLSNTADSCARNSSNLMECTFTLINDDRVLAPVAPYLIDNIKAVDAVTLNGATLKSDPAESIIVDIKHEDALIALDTANEVALQVLSDGGSSGTFSLFVDVQERGPANTPVDTVLKFPGQTATPGDISNAQVSMVLYPIGPGAEAHGSCTTVSVSPGIPVLSYVNVLRVECVFTAVRVNTYAVVANVVGDYYLGGPSEDVFTVFDPSLGFTTGGGWFYWPETEERTNYGFNMKYNRKMTHIQGSLLMVRHLADGTKYRIKSNAVEGLAVGDGDNGNAFGWASFNGKATYKDPSMTDAIGNYSYIVYIEDHAEPGKQQDRFWIQAFDKAGDLIPASSIDKEPEANAVLIEGGNIVVPHKIGKKSNR